MLRCSSVLLASRQPWALGIGGTGRAALGWGGWGHALGLLTPLHRMPTCKWVLSPPGTGQARQ